jgi:hypothetical protein
MFEPNDIEVRVEVLDHSVAWCSCVGCFRALDCWVSAGTITESYLARTHHADTASLDHKIVVDAASNLMVVFN